MVILLLGGSTRSHTWIPPLTLTWPRVLPRMGRPGAGPAGRALGSGADVCIPRGCHAHRPTHTRKSSPLSLNCPLTQNVCLHSVRTIVTALTLFSAWLLCDRAWRGNWRGIRVFWDPVLEPAATCQAVCNRQLCVERTRNESLQLPFQNFRAWQIHGEGGPGTQQAWCPH